MVTLQSLAQKFSSTLGLRARAPDLNTLRALCLELLVDVPEAWLLQRLEKMRRADDVWHVRSALFEAISLTHGEQVARDRLLVLDDKLG
jgi:hypothetical protein